MSPRASHLRNVYARQKTEITCNGKYTENCHHVSFKCRPSTYVWQFLRRSWETISIIHRFFRFPRNTQRPDSRAQLLYKTRPNIQPIFGCWAGYKKKHDCKCSANCSSYSTSRQPDATGNMGALVCALLRSHPAAFPRWALYPHSISMQLIRLFAGIVVHYPAIVANMLNACHFFAKLVSHFEAAVVGH